MHIAEVQVTGCTNGDACTSCAAGKYKGGTGSATCVDCGAGKYLGTQGATVESACVACPGNANSPIASTAVTACTCNVGSTGTDGGTCTSCAAGKYKIGTGSASCTDCGAGKYLGTQGASSAVACVSCPSDTFSGAAATSCEPCQANAVSVSGSASQEYCYCNSGYAHAAGAYTCKVCDPGTYNSQLGGTACSNCSVGLFSVHYGAVGNETCLACPIGQWSPEGSPNCNLCPANSRAGAASGLITSCACDAGYTGPNGGVCSPCAAGQYKNASGANACVNCVDGMFGMFSNASGASTCTSCPADQYSRDGVNCTMDVVAAFVIKMSVTLPMSRDDFDASAQTAFRESVALAAGVSSADVRIVRILDVDGGAVRRRLLTAGISVETSVQAASESVASAITTSLTAETLNSALAAAGLPPATILQAPAFAEPASSVTCAACAAFADGVCTVCTGNTVSAGGGAACECKAGFTGVGTSCTACPAGTYKRMSGSSACRTCQANGVSASGSALCACRPGYTGNTGDVCVACVAGKYKNATGPAACETCAGGRRSPAAAPNITSCVCNGGYTQVEDATLTFDAVFARACVMCAVGKFKAFPGTHACSLCPVDTYSEFAGFSECTRCAASSGSPNGSTSSSACTCNAGYTGPTYESVRSSSNLARSCGDGSEACPTEQSSDFGSYTADLAVDGDVSTSSNTMFANNQFWRVDFGRRVTITGALLFFAQHTADTLVMHVGDDPVAGGNRICASMNFLGTADAWKTVPCAAPITGQYLHVRNTVGSNLGLREIRPAGSENVTLLWPGYCEACPRGFFKEAQGNQVCQPCPANTFSNATAAPSAQACLACLTNATSAASSVSCECDLGFTAASGGCVACAFGKFKDVVGPDACRACPVNSVGLANARHTCACEAGYQDSWTNA